MFYKQLVTYIPLHRHMASVTLILPSFCDENLPPNSSGCAAASVGSFNTCRRIYNIIRNPCSLSNKTLLTKRAIFVCLPFPSLRLNASPSFSSPLITHFFASFHIPCNDFFSKSLDKERQADHRNVWRNMAEASSGSPSCQRITLQLQSSVIGGRQHVTTAPFW